MSTVCSCVLVVPSAQMLLYVLLLSIYLSILILFIAVVRLSYCSSFGISMHSVFFGPHRYWFPSPNPIRKPLCLYIFGANQYPAFPVSHPSNNESTSDDTSPNQVVTNQDDGQYTISFSSQNTWRLGEHSGMEWSYCACVSTAENTPGI